MIVAKNTDTLLKDEKLKEEIMQKLYWEFVKKIKVSDVYEQRRDDVMKCFHEEHSKRKFDRKEMELAYHGSDGHFYDRFPKNLGLPIDRFGKMKFFLMWMVQGISPDEINALLDKADDALGKGLTDPKNAAMIGKCHEEIRGRERLTIHTELLYNFLAVQWVRDDEDPLVYNNQIQLEKVDAFKKENEKGNSYFFFQQEELKMLSNLFKMSEEEWNLFWQESLSHQNFLKAFRMMKFSSGSESAE